MKLTHSWLCAALLVSSALDVGADIRSFPSDTRAEVFQQQTPLESEKTEEELEEEEEPDCE